MLLTIIIILLSIHIVISLLILSNVLKKQKVGKTFCNWLILSLIAIVLPYNFPSFWVSSKEENNVSACLDRFDTIQFKLDFSVKMWLNECILYVTKEPCAMCAGAIVNARIKMVIFGCYDENEGCCGSLYQLCGDPRFKVQVTVKGGVLENDCLGIIQEFFQKKRNKK